MHLFLITSAVFAVALVVHLSLWRVRMPRHHTSALLVIFALVFSLAILVLLDRTPDWPDRLRIAFLYLAASLCYVITYSAIEGDSPTLSLMRLLDARGGKGLPTTEVDHFLARRPFVKARLAALILSGHVREEGGRYRLAGPPSLPFQIILGFRKLYGPIAKGG